MGNLFGGCKFFVDFLVQVVGLQIDGVDVVKVMCYLFGVFVVEFFGNGDCYGKIGCGVEVGCDYFVVQVFMQIMVDQFGVYCKIEGWCGWVE